MSPKNKITTKTTGINGRDLSHENITRLTVTDIIMSLDPPCELLDSVEGMKCFVIADGILLVFYHLMYKIDSPPHIFHEIRAHNYYLQASYKLTIY